MNNEPVAWMFQGAFDISTYVSIDKPNPDIYPNPTPLYTHPVKEQEIEKLIGDLRNVAEAQGQKGCWDYDQYMLGLFNGLELALAIFEKREPQYRELPSHPVKDLEDIDINITWNENSMRDFGKDELAFARAILRKAQEK